MKIKRLLFIAVAVLLMGATANASGFKFGVKAGANFNKLHFSEEALDDLLNTDNQTGYTVGLMGEFTVPVIGIGVDLSAMWVHRPTLKAVDGSKFERDYIEIPINLKYKLSLPAVERIGSPYVYTGPSFAFKIGETEIKDFVKSQKCDISWNIGLGVELINHLQISGGYGFGITKLVNTVSEKVGEGQLVNPVNIESRNNCWTVTVAYLF